MKFLPAIITLALSCIPLLVTASQTVGNVTVYQTSQLDSQVSQTFLDCVKRTGVEYNLYVDEGGTTVVVPAERREIDFHGQDQELFDCIIAVTDRMDVAAESTIEPDENHDSAISSNSTTHEWLEEQGASGLAAVGTRPASTGLSNHTSGMDSSPSARSKIARRGNNEPRSGSLHYWAYLDDYPGCGNVNSEASFDGTCHTYASAFASVQFENTDDTDYLEMGIWPHHGCSKGNERKFTIKPGTLGDCKTRTTYSFKGWHVRCARCL
ncbi:hypothetical protein DTO164E3_1088 [Paecilomyces variotii]|nr:hypothetical protein DTO032I3_6251 [Paecilomyces variotii]KAJ9205835.1 hypothetical protein DTO164E3_1088 [Paecilomyces variotii]KAJ9227043.1 hypothetical protein DTO169C6_798 [Paecilomyces variotii]KAJ9275225.1 hypothetical protein DTO021D3_7871 [Paecilomyces variotii]KAJ9286375.1 hypothetical protein DTO021C3_6085 [Paecilomyces variotii]